MVPEPPRLSRQGRSLLPVWGSAELALTLFGAAFVLTSLTLLLLVWDLPWVAVLGGIVAFGCLAGSFRCYPRALGDRTLPAPSAQRHPPGMLGIGLIVVASLPADLAAWLLADTPTMSLAVGLYPLALILGASGEVIVRGLTVRAIVSWLRVAERRYRWEIVCVTAIVIGALVFRAWMISRPMLAHGTISDELEVGWAASGLAHGALPWSLYVTVGGAVAMYQPIAAAFAVFGDTIGVMRGVATIENVALIPAFYLLARQLVSAPAALSAATLLAFGYWPSIMGVLVFGWTNGALFQALGFALLLFGVRHRAYTCCAAGGWVLGLCLYSYLGHRFMPIPALFFLAAYLCFGQPTARVRGTLILVSLLGLVTCAIPWLASVSRDNGLLYGDSQSVSEAFRLEFAQHPIVAIGDMASTIGQVVTTLLYDPRVGGFSVLILPSGGLLDVITASAFLLGIVILFLRIGWIEGLLVWPALLLPLVVAGIAIDMVNVYRANGLLVPIYLCVALLVDYGLSLGRATPRLGHWVLGAAVLLTGWGVLSNVRTTVAQLSSCTVANGNAGPLDVEDGEPVLIADTANSYHGRRTVFVVVRSPHFDPPYWRWLFRYPVSFYTADALTVDPAHWQPAYTMDLPAGARFWPPQAGRGTMDVTYLIADDAIATFLPIARRQYPAAIVRSISQPICPNYVIVSFTISTRSG
jgi:hypothetical protein